MLKLFCGYGSTLNASRLPTVIPSYVRVVILLLHGHFYAHTCVDLSFIILSYYLKNAKT